MTVDTTPRTVTRGAVRGGRATARRSRTDDLGAALDLLDRARATLLEACRAETTADRFVAAHLGALRSAAALLAARPDSVRRGAVRTVWAHLTLIAPEMTEWADYFAVAGRRRAEIEAGQTPGRREADDLLRSAETFCCLVQAALGLPIESTLGRAPLAAVSWP